jgi:hypothetical protein
LLRGEREIFVKTQTSSHTKAANDDGLFTTYPTPDEPLHLFEACLFIKLPVNQLTENQSQVKTFPSRQKSTDTNRSIKRYLTSWKI